jgi:hypothetical protein
MDLPYYLGLLADAHLQAGDIDAGLAAVDEAMAESGDRDNCYAGELHRLRGLLLAQSGADAGAVVAELERARDIARRQRAPLAEARVSLALDQIATDGPASSDVSAGSG